MTALCACASACAKLCGCFLIVGLDGKLFHETNHEICFDKPKFRLDKPKRSGWSVKALKCQHVEKTLIYRTSTRAFDQDWQTLKFLARSVAILKNVSGRTHWRSLQNVVVFGTFPGIFLIKNLSNSASANLAAPFSSCYPISQHECKGAYGPDFSDRPGQAWTPKNPVHRPGPYGLDRP